MQVARPTDLIHDRSKRSIAGVMPARTRLREVHQNSISELADGLAPELREELERLTLPFDDDSVPSDAELRIAQAQLVGWLEGLFHGIQTAIYAQQMAARVQLEQMRRALPPGLPQPGGAPDGSAGPAGPGQPPTPTCWPRWTR